MDRQKAMSRIFNILKKLDTTDDIGGVIRLISSLSPEKILKSKEKQMPTKNIDVVRMVLEQQSEKITISEAVSKFLQMKTMRSKNPEKQARIAFLRAERFGVSVIFSKFNGEKYIELNILKPIKVTEDYMWSKFKAPEIKIKPKKTNKFKTSKVKKLSKKAQFELLLEQKATMFTEMVPEKAKEYGFDELKETIKEDLDLIPMKHNGFCKTMNEMTLEEFKEDVCEPIKEKWFIKHALVTKSPSFLTIYNSSQNLAMTQLNS